MALPIEKTRSHVEREPSLENEVFELTPLVALLRSQKSLGDQMTKFISNTKKAPIAKRTHGFYIARLNGWHDLWQSFLANEEKISQLKSDEDLSDEYFAEDHYSQREERFYEFKGELVDQLEKVEKAEKTAAPTASRSPGNIALHPEQHYSVQHNLPRISLPKFSGDYNDWISFRDLFGSVIHQNSNLDDVQKLHYLKTSLIGEAAHVIKQYSITNANYASAWKALTQRYENKRVLVSSLLKTLTSQAKISAESASALKTLLDVTNECLSSLNNLEINTAHWDPLIIHILTQKLSVETHKAWEESIGEPNDVPTWTEFKKFLELRFRMLEAIAGGKSKPLAQGSNTLSGKLHEPNKTRVQTFHAAQGTCQMCKANHSMRTCPKFLKLDPKTRMRVSKAKGCCLNCLGNYHSVNKCLSTVRCAECGAKHHTLLHHSLHPKETSPSKPKIKGADGADETKGFEAPTANVLNHFIAENRHVLLATAIVYIQSSGGLQVARALIDSGSQATFITNAALRRMKLSTTSTLVRITGLGNKESASSHRMAHLTLKSQHHDRAVQVSAIALDTLTDLLPAKALWCEKWEHLEGLHLADPAFFKPGRIDMIIGADIFPLILLDGVKTGPIGTPVAQRTIFGWILSGQISVNQPRPKPEILSLINVLDINQNLKQFWELEEVSIPKTKCPEDALCENLYKLTHSRRPDGSYVVRLPFKEDQEPENILGLSRHIAEKRLYSIERTAVQRGYEQEYREVLTEYLTSGHMEEVTDTGSGASSADKIYYIPHHAVIKPSSSSTKLRVVFDASCKTSSGKSLNDVLLTGPTLQQDIITILMRWRFYKYVFTADIEKMYRQIWIHPADSDYQRILWRDDETQPIKTYRLRTVTFGVSCAPFLAIRTLQQLAEDEKKDFPVEADCLKGDFYVDDVLTGRDTLEEITSLRDNLRSLLQRGGFRLCKFSSNNLKVLQNLPPVDITNESLLQFAEDATIKALGIYWNPAHDQFQYKLNLDLEGPVTKRTILSKIAKLFDPLGWLSPIIITAKIFMQSLWLAGLEWDDPLPLALQHEWQSFNTNLQRTEEIRIPRWIRSSFLSNLEIHGFCDSSEKDYAAVIYARVQTETKETSTHLLISKTRVAPIKSVSLPRLELCGAHLLSKLVRSVRKNLTREAKIYLWTDSTVVLDWLKGHPNRWKSFVANRVTDIHNNVENASWRHVPSKENPADLASRGVPVADLIRNDLWWQGPLWLSHSPSAWSQLPVLQKGERSDEELRKVKSYHIQEKRELLIERFSNLTKAFRVIAFCKRFIVNCKSKSNDRCCEMLSSSEIEEARYILIRESQEFFFQQELNDLRIKRKISVKSSLLSLHPFLDKNDILRVGGRLEHCNLSFNEKHPIILPRNSKLASPLIDHFHKISLHGGLNLVLYSIRKQYWIPGVKASIRKHIHLCTTCIRWAAKGMNQIMADLPSQRVRLERPFLNAGVDFAGPIHIKLNKTRNAKTSKAYIAIFVCFAVKDVHIEAVRDLSAEAFLASLRRFFSRRGLSKNIYSDNGTNFVGASRMFEKEMQAAISSNNRKAAEHYANQNVQWHFIPPGAPHFGGLWEAGVKSIKYHLRRILGQSLLTFEELTTVLVQIEGILNSRLLCPLTSDPEELTSLTPAHFLIGDTLLSPPETDWSKTKLALLSRWQLLQKLKQDFWIRVS